MPSKGKAAGTGHAPITNGPQITSECPLNKHGCNWRHTGKTHQLQKIISHLNDTHAAWLMDGWLKRFYVNEVVGANSKLRFCECGKPSPGTTLLDGLDDVR